MKNKIIALLLCLAGAIPGYGQCWEEILNISPYAQPNFGFIHTVCTINDSIFWVGGQSNILCVTRDRGESWEFGYSPYSQQTFGRPGIVAIHFLDESRGFIGAPNSVPMMTTSDGGETWTAVSATLIGGGQQIIRNVSGIRFVSSTHGWAVSVDGSIFKTEDGGNTWHCEFQDASAPWTKLLIVKPPPFRRQARREEGA